MSLILRIAIDTPLRRLFDYLPPAGSEPSSLLPGQRLWVPFGRRRVIGVLVELARQTDIPLSKLRRAHALIDAEPMLDAKLFGLLLWAGDYYRHPIGEVLAAALPGALRSGAALTATREHWRLTELGRNEARSKTPKRATRLHALIDALEKEPSLEAEVLAAAHPEWRPAMRTLRERGYVESFAVNARAATVTPFSASVMPHELGLEQQAALTAIVQALGTFRTLLLHGVTGSGKTEVYLRAIAEVLARGKQALVLAPEIALTPQLLERFRTRFTVPIAVLHSGLNDGERLAAWRAARGGEAGIVIGTRSAIFTPLARPGLIIVDEEHDASYKQQEGFRYSARDLSIARAQRHDIPVILGSATPALETLHRAQRSPAGLLVLPQRAGNALPPTLKLIDLRQHASNQGLSTPVMQAIRQHLDAQGQVLLYLNRRGYAPVLFCPSCGWSAPCPRCDARLTVHRRQATLQCHHCGHEQALLEACPSCNAPLKPVGQGTERVEDTLAALYPDAPVARIDRDSVSRKGELDATLARVHAGAVKLLIGTQMLSKGHHFPNVTLAVILNADQGLFSADFRGSERLAQSILQVAGRAGRGDRAGEVLIQTEFPDHPFLQRLLSGGYEAFAAAALEEREQAHWPPFARLALLRAEAADTQAALRFLQTAKQIAFGKLRKSNDAKVASKKLRILGPAPAPMTRRAGFHRAQLLFHSPSPASLQQLLATVIPQLETLPEAKRVRWSVDVDPIELS